MLICTILEIGSLNVFLNFSGFKNVYGLLVLLSVLKI